MMRALMRGWLRSAYWALVLIGAGVFLLVRNTTTAGRLEHVRLWPLLLIALGVWILLERVGRWWGRAGGLFVPLLLVGVGVVLVLRDGGVISGDVSLWPVVLIALGLAILGAAVPWGGRPSLKRSEERIPLEGATRARIVVDYGGGRLTVRPATSIGVLLEGTFTGPPEISVRRDGDRVEAHLRPKRGWRPPWGPGTTWSLGLSRDIPLSLAFHVGAASSDIDLAEVRAEDVEIQTGASQTTLAVPSRGRSTVRVHGGAADFRIRIPDGVAASIRTRTGMASVRVDPRFPRVDGGYRTLGFDEAPNRVELDVDVGAASVQVL